MTGRRITDDLDALRAVLPPPVTSKLTEINRPDDLLEIILDIGRIPTARFVDGEVPLSPDEVDWPEIEYVVERIGEFDADNRAGIERTLHRISAIRNRRGRIVGLTCRVGRAVYGTIEIIQDLIESGKSLLLLGRPGVGKTTMLREAARILAERRRVVIVDTSNEIGGDGDVPHPAVGRARRMQVPTPSLQHEVMIEAVENHNPEVIVIDEIGRELEAAAARTIAERGVQLIGTAHGNTLENLLLNPTLSDLVGGIESVTLSDEEARRRGTQKTVLERRAAPTFDVLIEIQDRERLAMHHDVSAAVDAMLRGRPLPPELRFRDAGGQVQVQRPAAAPPRYAPRLGGIPPPGGPPQYAAARIGRVARLTHSAAAARHPTGHGPHLSLRRRPQSSAHRRQAAACPRPVGGRRGPGRGAGHAALVLPPPAQVDLRRRGPQHAHLRTASQHRGPDGELHDASCSTWRRCRPRIPRWNRPPRRRRRPFKQCSTGPARWSSPRPRPTCAGCSMRWPARPTWSRTPLARNPSGGSGSSAIEYLPLH